MPKLRLNALPTCAILCPHAWSRDFMVLRTIRSNGSEFVPQVSVTLAMVLALASLGVLIYCIHDAAGTIQAPEVTAMVAEDLTQGIDKLFPEALGRPPADSLY